MSNTYTDSGYSGESSKHSFCDLLPEYATIIVLGESPPERFKQLEEHLDQCAECQADFDDLLELAIAAYTERLEPPVELTGPQLTFLQAIAQRSSAAHVWHRDRHTLVVFLSAAVLQAVHEQ